jgi:hypothetical protein
MATMTRAVKRSRVMKRGQPTDGRLIRVTVIVTEHASQHPAFQPRQGSITVKAMIQYNPSTHVCLSAAPASAGCPAGAIRLLTKSFSFSRRALLLSAKDSSWRLISSADRRRLKKSSVPASCQLARRNRDATYLAGRTVDKSQDRSSSPFRFE